MISDLPPSEPAAAPEPRAADEVAWAEVLARWEDDEAHRGYLSRQPGLDGLAVAGRRYREALAARPGDPVAVRWREEILRRATMLGLAALPRTGPPRRASAVRRIATAVVLALVAAVVALLVARPGLQVFGAGQVPGR